MYAYTHMHGGSVLPDNEPPFHFAGRPPCLAQQTPLHCLTCKCHVDAVYVPQPINQAPLREGRGGRSLSWGPLRGGPLPPVYVMSCAISRCPGVSSVTQARVCMDVCQFLYLSLMVLQSFQVSGQANDNLHVLIGSKGTKKIIKKNNREI